MVESRARTALRRRRALLSILQLVIGASLPGVAGADAAICGYASTTSVAQGGELELHVSTTAPSFDIQVEDALDASVVLAQLPGVAGVSHPVPDSSYANGCDWPVSATVPVGPAWPSGVYYARLVAPSEPDTAFVPFIVLEDEPGSTSNILFQCSFNTYQAYNNWGGKSLYPQNSTNGVRSYFVSFDRPFAQEDGRGEFPWWERSLALFLRVEDIPAEFCTNVDLHLDPTLLDAYDLFMSVGHDEYWSKEMYDQADAFRDAGGDLAFFCGNSVYWAVRLQRGGRQMVCYKDYTLDPYYDAGLLDQVTDLWGEYPLDRPEAGLIGVSFDQWCSKPCGAPIRPREANHWILRGLGVSWNEPLGVDVVGYEWDRTRQLASPPAAQVVFESFVTDHNGHGRIQQSTYYEYPGDPVGPPLCRVFGGGTIQWSRGVEGPGADPRLQAMTGRIVRCLSSPQRIDDDRDAVFQIDLTAAGLDPETEVRLHGSTPPIDTEPALLHDDGAWPDDVAADGIYATAVSFPAGTWSVVEYWYATTEPCSNRIFSVWIDDPETLVGDVAQVSLDRLYGCPQKVAVADDDGRGGRQEGPAVVDRLRLVSRRAGRGVLIEAAIPAHLVGLAARASVYDVRGRLVTTLGTRAAAAAREVFLWAGTDARGGRRAHGVYFVRLSVGGESRVGKLVWVE